MKIDEQLVINILLWCRDNLPNSDRNYQSADIILPGHSQEEIEAHIDYLVARSEIRVDVFIKETGNGSAFYNLIGLSPRGYQHLAMLNLKINPLNIQMD